MDLWYYPEEELPPEGKYVLIELRDMPWIDSTDQDGVMFKVARCLKGISLKERNEMSEDNPRKRIIKASDEEGNNLVPYYFSEFGPDSYFGQNVIRWRYIPV